MSDFKEQDLVQRLSEINEESREDIANLFSDPTRAASFLNIINDANLLDIATCRGALEHLPARASAGLTEEDIARITRISFDPDEFEFLVDFYTELYPEHGNPLAEAANEFYDECVEDAADGIQDQILSDREASSVVMELALPLSHRFDKDQQTVADDIIASFTYKHGSSPEDYADSVRIRNEM
ncbi:hypothetical protein G6L37_03245 [Agrobacterium rubi]|nr:hypothetical protein [Agrobacterium rubi]NTF24391.1 hypothetical protein [Agrobacterium rubi]